MKSISRLAFLGVVLLLAPRVLVAQVPSSGGTPQPAVVASCGSQTLTVGQNAQLSQDTSGKLCISSVGSGGTSSNFGAAFPTAGTAVGFKDSTGANMAAGNLDASGNLKISCAAGNCGGAAADTVGTTAALNATNAAASVALAGEQGAEVFIASGTLAGTLLAEVSGDGGTTWSSASWLDPSSGAVAASVVVTNPNAAILKTVLWFGSATNVRVRVNPYTSGTANATVRAVTASPVTMVYGSTGTSLVPLSLNNSGGVRTQDLADGSLNAGIGTTGMLIAGSSTGVNGLTAIQVNDSGVQRVDPSGTTSQPVVGNVASGAADSGNPVKIGGVFNTTQPTVANGQRVDIQSTNRGAQIVATGVDTFTVTANAGTNLNTSALALDTSVNGVIVAQASTTSGQKGPLVQGAVTTAAPTYTTAQTSPLSLTTAGALRVDGSAVTQPVSGTVTANAGTGNFTVVGNVASGSADSGNPVKISGVFNTTQPTVTTGQRVDIQSTARGAQIVATGTDTFNVTVNAALPTGANTIGAVTQASGPWTENLTQVASNNVVTAATGVQKVGIVGNAGAVFDAAGQNVASPANELLIGGQFNTTPTTITSGNMSPLQLDSSGNLLVNIKAGAGSGGTAAADNSAFTAGTTNVTPMGAIYETSVPSITAGNVGAPRMDVNRVLLVDCSVGCAAAGDSTTASTALGALNATIAVALAGDRGATFQLQSGGTGVYTVTPQCSFDGGTLYNANGYIQDPFTGVVSTTATIASAQATTDYPVMCPQGASHAQVKVTSYTSGTANWLARATVTTWPDIVWGVVTTAAPSYTTGQINSLSLNTSGALRVDGSGVTQPVSGTVTANIGTTNGLALDSSVNGIIVAQASTTSGQKGPLVQGAVTTAAPSYTTAQTDPLSLTTGGALRIDITTIAGTAPTTVGKLDVKGADGDVFVRQATASNLNAQVVGTIASGAADSGNPVKTGGVFNTTQPTVTNAQRVDAQYTARGAAIVSTGVDTFNVTVNAALPTGANTIGAVTQASGPWTENLTQVASNAVVTAATGVQKVGIVGNTGAAFDAAGQNVASPANELLIGGQFNTTPTTITSGNMSPLQLDSSANLLVNLKTALPTGANTIGAVTQASGPWTVNMTQIGSTNVVTGGASGLLAVAGPVASGAANADNPVKIGGAFNTTQPTVTTGQVVDFQATARGAQIVATGTDTFNVTVNAALPTGANTIGAVTQASGPWTDNVTQFGGTNISTGTGASGAGIPRITVSNDSQVRILGNAGGIIDAAGQNASSPANELLIGGQFNTTPTTITSGNISPLQLDSTANLLVNCKTGCSGGSASFVNAFNGNTGNASVDTFGDLITHQQIAVNIPNPTIVPQLLRNTMAQIPDVQLVGSFGMPIGSNGNRMLVDIGAPQDPCASQYRNDVAISQTATARYITGRPYLRWIICQIRIVAGAAEITSEWEGTGTTCGTGTIAHSGSTTAANGESFAANGGYQSGGTGAGVSAAFSPDTDFCIAQNGTSRVSGKISYVWAP
jgi:uncharacterized phage-associated protein